jgi:hypothetical protein
MNTAAHEAPDARGLIATVEGYLALVIVVLCFLVPRVDHPSNNEAIVGAVSIGIAFGLALGGVRFGEGGGRNAARIALGILSLWILVVLAASIVRWEQIIWYWRG